MRIWRTGVRLALTILSHVFFFFNDGKSAPEWRALIVLCDNVGFSVVHTKKIDVEWRTPVVTPVTPYPQNPPNPLKLPSLMPVVARQAVWSAMSNVDA